MFARTKFESHAVAYQFMIPVRPFSNVWADSQTSYSSTRVVSVARWRTPTAIRISFLHDAVKQVDRKAVNEPS